jgi:hypothetical protein
MKFNTIHSLGSRCQNSEILKKYNYREFSGFFDFMNTQKFNVLEHIITDDFNEILKPENNLTVKCNKTTFDPETGECLPTSFRTINKQYNITDDMDMAIFPHHDLNLEKDYNHFVNCKKRFKNLKNFNTLFNYTFNTWENDVSLENIEKLVNSLIRIHEFENFKICFIGLKVSSLQRATQIISNKYYDVWQLEILPSSYTGGLFINDVDNENYINIIKTYDIDDNRITKEEIDMEKKENYSSWPIGQVPKHLQRPELDQIKNLGYHWDDPRDVVDMFEKKVAKFSGSKYAVSIDCCSHGLFLAIKYLQSTGELLKGATVTIPKMTYVSAPMQIIHAENEVAFEDLEWSGVYQLKGSRVWDGAVRWTENMYVGMDALQVISFQLKKRIPIGKGGMILTDSLEAYNWLKLASYDGRDLSTPYTSENHVKMNGYHMYMTPEDAARGIIIMDQVPSVNEDTGNHTKYVDVSKMIKN